MAMAGFLRCGVRNGRIGAGKSFPILCSQHMPLVCVRAYVLVHVCEYIDMRTQMSFQSPGQDLGCHLLSLPYCFKTGSLPEPEVWLGWLA